MFWFRHNYRPIRRFQLRDESIPDSSNRLHKSRLLGIVIEDLPNFADRGVDTVVNIHENAFAPYPFGNCFPGYDFATLLDEHKEHLQRDVLELHDPPPAAKLKC